MYKLKVISKIGIKSNNGISKVFYNSKYEKKIYLVDIGFTTL